MKTIGETVPHTLSSAFIILDERGIVRGNSLCGLHEDFSMENGSSLQHCHNTPLRIVLQRLLAETMLSPTPKDITFQYDGKAYNITSVKMSIMGIGEQVVHCTFAPSHEQNRMSDGFMREQSQLSDQIFRFSGEGMAIMDLNSLQFVTVNQRFRKIFGYANNADLGKLSFYDTIINKPKGSPAFSRIFPGMMERLVGGKAMQLRHLCRRANGTPFQADLSFWMINTGLDKTYIACLVNDISEQLNHSAELQKTKIRFQRMFETNALGVVYGIPGYILDVNATMTEMFGYAKEEFIGKSGNFFTHPLDREMNSARLAQLSEERESWTSIKKRYIRKDGSMFWGKIWLTSFIEDGTKYVLGIIQDIDQEKKATQALEENMRVLDGKNKELQRYIESNEELERFAYIASHDLKEPIRSLVGFSQLLQRYHAQDLDAEALEYLNYIEKSAQNMNDLIEDILHYSTIDHGEAPLAPVSVRDSINKAMVFLQQAISEADAMIEVGALPQSINGHEMQIREVFLNLLSNAIKFRHKERTCHIKITYKETPKEWIFHVEDNGIGIPERYIGQIFQLFKRLESRTEYQGTGIGLGICKKVVERHGGRIWVCSEEGKGSTFSFSIPK